MDTLVKQKKFIEFNAATFEIARMAYQFAENGYLEDMLEDLQPSLQRACYAAIHHDGAMEESLAFLRALIEKVVAHDEQGAVSALERFGEHQRDTVLSCL